MALITVTVQGADGVDQKVLLDSITGQEFAIPFYKMTIGELGVDDGPISSTNPMPAIVKGTIAHDSPDTGDGPVKIGGKASIVQPSTVAVNDIVNAYFDIHGRLHTKIDNLPLTAFDDLRTAELSPIFQGTFEYTVDNTEITTNTVANGGTVTQAAAMAVVGTSTTTASNARLESRQHAKYRAGQGGVARFTALFTSPVAGTDQFVGLADEVGSSEAFKNGYIVGYSGTTFGFHRFSNDTLTTIDISTWDDPLDGSGPSGMTIDHTKLNVFYLQFEYLGGGPINIFVADEVTKRIIQVHSVPYANLFTEPSVLNPNFRFVIRADNKATTSNIVVQSASFSFFVEGKVSHINLHVPTQSTGEKQKTGVTAEVAIVTIRNKATYVGKTNFIDVLVLEGFASIEASSANNLGRVRLVKNAALGGVPSYADINTSNSVVEFDVAGTTVTGGIDILTMPLAGKNSKDSRDISAWQILLNPGETLTLAGLSANSATINSGVTWHELF